MSPIKRNRTMFMVFSFVSSTLSRLLDKGLEVLGVFLLDSQDLFEHPARRGIVLAKVPYDFAVGFDGDPLRHEILADHIHKIAAFDVLAMAPRRQPLPLAGVVGQLILDHADTRHSTGKLRGAGAGPNARHGTREDDRPAIG